MSHLCLVIGNLRQRWPHKLYSAFHCISADAINCTPAFSSISVDVIKLYSSIFLHLKHDLLRCSTLLKVCFSFSFSLTLSLFHFSFFHLSLSLSLSCSSFFLYLTHFFTCPSMSHFLTSPSVSHVHFHFRTSPSMSPFHFHFLASPSVSHVHFHLLASLSISHFHFLTSPSSRESGVFPVPVDRKEIEK